MFLPPLANLSSAITFKNFEKLTPKVTELSSQESDIKQNCSKLNENDIRFLINHKFKKNTKTNKIYFYKIFSSLKTKNRYSSLYRQYID